MRATKRLVLTAALATLSLPVVAAAQENLALPAGYDYSHDHSGIVIPFAFGDLKRGKAIEFHPDQLDVGLTFEGAPGEVFLSVYLFRKTNGAVPVWFAQGVWGIENRDIYAGATLAYQPSLVTLPGRTAPTGLTAVYDTSAGEVFTSTGLALFGAGGWYIKVRASSPTKTPDQLLVWIDEVLNQIAVPSELEGEVVTGPVLDCAEPLAFSRKSKDAKSDATDGIAAALIEGLLRDSASGVATEAVDAPVADAAVWCRDSTVTANYTAYRENASSDAYLLAFGDNGNALFVKPDAGRILFDAQREGLRLGDIHLL